MKPRRSSPLPHAAPLAMALGTMLVLSAGPTHAQDASMHHPTAHHASPDTSLTARQLAIAPVTAWAAVGDMPCLRTALEQALDTGMSIQEAKELLVQVYAYAGFPRSLNALGEFMQLVDARKQRGVQDTMGREPGAVPTGDALLALGTANQTRLAGAPVTGPLFEFAPAIDVFLKSHLFGDIFARDNLDWQSREIATVSMLAALPGVDGQLQAHMRISLNTGLTASQLQQVVQVLTSQVDAASGARAQAALARQLRVQP